MMSKYHGNYLVCNTGAPPRRRRAQPERALQVGLVEHLAPPGVWFSHFPAGDKRSRIAGALMRCLGTRSGVPDLLLVSEGRLFGLELKNGTRGKLTPAQECHAAMRSAGATIGTGGTIDEALDLLTEWGVFQ
jgi:hypothetical protein